MDFDIRKSFTIGLLRLNLSKSGLGTSMGVKGARLGLSAKGTLYAHLSRGGLYHRQDLSSLNPEPATSSRGIGFWILIALGIFLSLFIALAMVTAADRLDVFDQEGRRQGYVVQQADRLDLFDRDSRRQGSGTQRRVPSGCGSWDLFRPDGSRLGVIQPGLGGLPSRLVLQLRKR
ncbi:MAG: hypothetical protein A3H39_10085 [candidate division NC10 bacterium RIFCSPLOWO2_02_FULL_66_22]|nr:MAG: hypothetical protein A3H39_10085 [candidate division NC10 bacterium RIFCSPLOWO2_02_FULL_66_22]